MSNPAMTPIRTAAASSESERREFLAAGLAFVQSSREIILDKIRYGFKTELKLDGSYVTDADKAAEETLRRAIEKEFPDHGIIGEEFGCVRPDAEYQWTLDPIDGTLSFVRGIPLYGTIVALRHRGRSVIGIIDHPSLDRCYSAGAGLGAFCNEHRISIHDVKSPEAIKDEVIAVGDRSQFVRVGMTKVFDSLMRSYPHVRGYTDCFGHALAAAGSVGAMVDVGIRLWDIAATEVLIAEAGGRLEYVQTPKTSEHGGLYGIVCGKPKVVAWLAPMMR